MNWQVSIDAAVTIIVRYKLDGCNTKLHQMHLIYKIEKIDYNMYMILSSSNSSIAGTIISLNLFSTEVCYLKWFGKLENLQKLLFLIWYHP